MLIERTIRRNDLEPTPEDVVVDTNVDHVARDPLDPEFPLSFESWPRRCLLSGPRHARETTTPTGAKTDARPSPLSCARGGPPTSCQALKAPPGPTRLNVNRSDVLEGF